MIPLIIAGAAAGLAGQLGGAAISGYYADKASEREADARREAAAQLRQQGAVTDAQYNQLIDQINQYYNTRGSLGTRSDVNAYKQAISNYNPEDYAADVGEFNYGKTVEDFTNPYYAQIIGQTRDQLQHTAAGAGLGRGTGAALNIAQGVASKSDELYNTAMNQYNQDRSFEYQKYADAIRNNQNRLNALNSANQYTIGLQGNLASNYYDTQDSRMSDIMQAQQDRLNAQTGYASALAGLY
jgi:hypothetical protein